MNDDRNEKQCRELRINDNVICARDKEIITIVERYESPWNGKREKFHAGMS